MTTARTKLGRHGVTSAIAALVLCAVGLTSCDQNVKFTIFRAKLDDVRTGMAQYTQPDGAGAQCVLDPDRVDVGMLPLYTRRDQDLGRTVRELLVPGDLLAGCVLRLVDDLQDTAKECNVGKDDISFSLTDIHLLSSAPDAGGVQQKVCCGVGCVASDKVTAVDDCAATYGDGWTCNQNRNVCERDFAINALSFTFDPVGELGADRVVALVMDNSGSLLGYGDDGVPHPSDSTDRDTDGRQGFRIAALKGLTSALGAANDQVALYTYDTAGITGVQQQTKSGNCAEVAQDGWVAAGHTCLDETIKGLDLLVSSNPTGSPIYDAVVRAAGDLRARAAATGGNPILVVFADGPPDATDSALIDAINAAQNNNADPTDDIPVFVVHLDNIVVMDPPTGRYADYDALACATGGAYYYVDNADHLNDVYQKHLPFLTKGQYRLQVGYTELKLGDQYPAHSCYAIKTQVGLTIEGVDRTLALQKTSSLTGGGAKFDSRIHVCKE